jgi:uncharacterized protein YecT (DUF1311 family)
MKSLKGCDSEALYFGIGMPADPVKARKCAFVEQTRADEEGITRSSPYYGRGMLMTIYANGVGANRNLEIATHLACSLGDAPAEMESRILRLADANAKNWQGGDFDPCSDATSGFLGGECAAHESRLAEVERNERLLALARRSGFAGKADWIRLERLARSYADAHGYNETDMSGTLRGAMFVWARDGELESFIQLMERMAAGTIPDRTPADLAKADAELNSTYKAILADDERFASEGSGLTREGAREAERAWLAYRDSMLAFARSHYPDADLDGLATLLTVDRTAAMNGSDFG